MDEKLKWTILPILSIPLSAFLMWLSAIALHNFMITSSVAIGCFIACSSLALKHFIVVWK